jgi:hypothetical protein
MVSISAGQDIDLVFRPQQNFTSARLKALGDAGVAYSGDISMGQNNPALLFSSCKDQENGMIVVGYGRDSLFNRHIMPLSFAHTNAEGAIGGFYRFQSGDCGLVQHEFTANFSGQLFDKADVQGAVDFGINVRYEIMKDKRHESRPLTVERYTVDRNGTSTYRSTIDTVSGEYNGNAGIRRCIADIGFYQPDIMDRLDFGLVIRNLIGYQWKKQNPYVVAADSVVGDTIVTGDTLTVINRNHSFRYETKKGKAWLPGRYRTLTIGVLYRSVNGPIQLLFPVDIEIMGLFDGKIKNSFVFRGGVAAQVNDAFTIRLGYARKPKTIIEGVNLIKNVNVFTGGAGLIVAQVAFDCYFSQDAFGVTAGFGL